MASKLLLALLPFLLLLSPAGAHNITRILEQFPEFSTFNALLNQSGIAAEINRRQTITVLAVENSAASALASLAPDTLEQVLAVHVILDYYGVEKIHNLKRKTTLFTTLFQTTGVASNRMGFLNGTKLSDGRFAFGSAVPGAQLVATFVKSVAAKPYNISVLQITNPIVPPGISDAPMAPFGAPISVPPELLVPAPAPVDAPVDDGPAEAPEASAPSPAADAPVADAPAADAPGPAPAAGDEADKPHAAKDEEEKSSAVQVAGGVSLGLVMAGVVFLAL